MQKNFISGGVSVVGFLLLSAAVQAQTITGWSLLWADEFTQTDGTLPNPSNWNYDIGGSDWGNNELQYYTSRSENARIEGGQLVIEARAETYSGKSYTSARLLTKDKLSWKYGRIEARIKIPWGQGIWPAFWALGSNIDTIGWPGCGEIDIMENIGREPSIAHGTIHGPGYSGGAGITGDYTLSGASLADDFHVYAIEWAENRISWFVDGQQFFTVTPSSLPSGTSWVYNQNHFLILNVAVGGYWPGYPDGSTILPQRMSVDYVRVYTPNAVVPTVTAPTTAAPTPTDSSVVSLFSNAYTNVPMRTWRASWSGGGALTDTTVAGNDVKKYEALAYFGAEPLAPIDASAMTNFHIDVWTKDVTTFKVKLVDFGANGTYLGGDDTEHEVTLSAPTLGSWTSYNVALSSFTKLLQKNHIAQLIPSGSVGTIYIDNVYFSGPAPIVTYSQAQYDAALAAATASGRTAGRTDVTSDPGSYGLYTEMSIQDVRTTGQVMVTVGASSVNLVLPVQKSTTLGSWQAAGDLQLTIPKDAGKQFYRIKVN